MQKSLTTTLLLLTLTGPLSAGHALAVPVATTQVLHTCEVSGDDTYFFGAPLPTAVQHTECSLDSSGTGPYGAYTEHAEGRAVADLGTTAGAIGVTTAKTLAYSDNGIAESYTYAGVSFYFHIELIGGPPVPGISAIPILMSAAGVGQAEREGYGIVDAYGLVQASGGNLDSDDARFEFRAYVVDETAFDDSNYYEDITDSFDESKSLNLLLAGVYTVTTSARCSSWVAPIGGQSEGAIARCSGWVDPMFSFDQAAFDSQMGEDTFALADYYRLVFSANIPRSPPSPMPVPSSIALFAAGLLALTLSRQRRQRPTACRE
jgi:hypothetical protein